MLTIHWGASQSQGVFAVFPKKTCTRIWGGFKPSETNWSVSRMSAIKNGLARLSHGSRATPSSYFSTGTSQPKDAPLKGGLEKKDPSSQLDLDSLKARIGWPSPNVTRAPLVGDSQYLHRILLAPKPKKNKLYWHCLPKRKPDLSSKLECSCTSSGNRCRISKRFLLPAEVPGGSESIDEEIRVLKSLLPCIIPCCTSFAMTRNPSSWLWSWKLHAQSAIHSDWLSTSASP